MLLCGLLACSGQKQDQADTEQLKKNIQAFYDAVEAGDVEAVIALFSEDVIIMPNGGEFSHGKEAAAAMWRRNAPYNFRIKDLQTVELASSGDIAYKVNDYYWSVELEGQEREWHKTKNIHIWRRQPDGDWRLHVDIWNATPEE
jgi:uncharacterized protein (TIGR02246 family)